MFIVNNANVCKCMQMHSFPKILAKDTLLRRTPNEFHISHPPALPDGDCRL